ncbi:hypothetical protein [Arthrobacter castelli]|uniref:hypothetical protein n=1 Tax=Arthrobacter castelli TaxID=271431 RepID=UPI00041F40CB|nr:hypothetical protein [Arthrobacter castelli]
MKLMKKTMLLAPAVALGLTAMGAAPAMADHAEGSYSTMLNQVNNSGASGEAWVTVEGSEATVTIETSGLAETFKDAAYPHVQHIHIGAQGTCPTMADDANGDGVISTVEGKPAYGAIGTTLSVGSAAKDASTATDVTVAPSGSSYTYKETFELNEKTQDALANGTAVAVVHGLNPANQPAAATETMSGLPGAAKLPLAATAPALCGPLQMMPAGGADTGVTPTEQGGTNEMGMYALGGGLIAAAGAGYAIRRSKVAGR